MFCGFKEVFEKIVEEVELKLDGGVALVLIFAKLNGLNGRAVEVDIDVMSRLELKENVCIVVNEWVGSVLRLVTPVAC